MAKHNLQEQIAALRHNVHVASIQGRSAVLVENHAATWIANTLEQMANAVRQQDFSIERLSDGLKTIADGELGTIEEAINYANTLILASLSGERS